MKEHQIDGQLLTGMSESDLMSFFGIADRDKAAALHTEIATLVNKANKQGILSLFFVLLAMNIHVVALWLTKI